MPITHTTLADNSFTPLGKSKWEEAHTISAGSESAPTLAPATLPTTGWYFATGKILGSIGGAKSFEVNGDSFYAVTSAGAAITSATGNILLGLRAGRLLTSGSSNVVIGSDAGRSGTTWFDSIVIGHLAGFSLANGDGITTGGFQEVLIGEQAGTSLSTGPNNTMVGSSAGKQTTTGGSNTFIGRASANANQTGGFNTAVGHATGFQYTGGDSNTWIGNQAGNAQGAATPTTGSSNVAIGELSGSTATGVNNTICIGTNATVSTSNATRLGNTSTSTCAIMGTTTLSNKLYPATDAAAVQTAAAIYAGSGAPNNSNGANGDFYLRGDGTAAGNNVIYHKEAGSWVALVTT